MSAKKAQVINLNNALAVLELPKAVSRESFYDYVDDFDVVVDLIFISRKQFVVAKRSAPKYRRLTKKIGKFFSEGNQLNDY